ncbi:polysialyltransferase family glycosyltransferase, partial [Legionella pneumophila subsp. fraseri]|nr:polysialyltransferase family glycosyltransferase [Legionella pneumophila subsp. fraseri]MDX1846716.1 polysialyltransferase family glycosyltransferase [Legionella pneumophila subsp. fraseri]
WFDHRSNSSFMDIISKLTRIDNCQVYMLTLSQRLFALSEFRLLKKRVEYLTKFISSEAYDSFYYAHDLSADHTAQTIMQAFPDLFRVCFGDPPGFLYKNYTSLSECLENIAGGFKGFFWKSRLRGLHAWYGYDKAYVAMNLGDDEQNRSLMPTKISSSTFIDLLDLLKHKLPNLEGEERAFVKKLESCDQNKPFQLLVLSNFTKSGLISRKNEFKLYLEICHRHCEPGSILIIKPHISSDPAFQNALKSKLSEYEVILFPETLRCVPLEMLTVLLGKCNIISVSSASIFLAYLYGKQRIIHALALEDIKRFFNKRSYSYMIKSTEAIMTTLQDMS